MLEPRKNKFQENIMAVVFHLCFWLIKFDIYHLFGDFLKISSVFFLHVLYLALKYIVFHMLTRYCLFDWLFVAYAFLFITWFASYRFPLKVFTEKINTLLLFYIISQHQWVKYGFCAAVFHETLTLLNHPVSLNVEFIQLFIQFRYRKALLHRSLHQ